VVVQSMKQARSKTGTDAHRKPGPDRMDVESPVTTRHEVYKRIGATELAATVYLPPGWSRSDSRAGIVFFGGGGWIAQNPAQFMHQAVHLAEHGVVAITAAYRTRSQNGTTPFESVKDAKSAVRWMRANAGALGLDPSRIIASGGSAGGHIAACAATVPGLDEDDEDPRISSAPDGLVLFNPALDLAGSDFSLKVHQLLVELGVGSRAEEISPTRHVRPGIVPTVIFHGTDDRLVPFSQAQTFCERMHSAGNRCVLYPAKGQDHGFFNYLASQKLNKGKWYRFCLDRTRRFVLSFQPKRR